MNETLRRTLLIGCLLIAGLEVPRAALLVLEDFEGPYAPPSAARAAGVPDFAAAVGDWLCAAPRLAAVSCLPWTLGKSPLFALRTSRF